MKIVIDTNVVISGTFFGGAPRRVIESVGKNGIHACATPEIIEEYEEIVEESIFASEIFSKNGRYLTFFVQKTIRIPVSNKQARRKPPPIRSCT